VESVWRVCEERVKGVRVACVHQRTQPGQHTCMRSPCPPGSVQPPTCPRENPPLPLPPLHSASFVSLRGVHGPCAVCTTAIHTHILSANTKSVHHVNTPHSTPHHADPAHRHRHRRMQRKPTHPPTHKKRFGRTSSRAMRAQATQAQKKRLWTRRVWKCCARRHCCRSCFNRMAMSSVRLSRAQVTAKRRQVWKQVSRVR